MTAINKNPDKIVFQFSACLFAVLGLTAWLYWPGIAGPLLLDDFATLGALRENGGVDDLNSFLNFVFGNETGPTGRPVSMVSFLVDTQSWPPDIEALKLTNVMLHLGNGVLIAYFIFLLSSLLGASKRKALFVALTTTSLWLVHPLNVSTTLYVVQRMTQLMTFFSLITLILYLHGRSEGMASTRKGIAFLITSLFPFALLALLSKENGALVLLMIVVCEICLFRNVHRSLFTSYWYRIGVIAPLIVIAGYFLITLPEMLETYETRHFTLAERVLTQFRILSFYLFKIFVPSLARNGLYNDDIVVSQSLFDPVSTFLSIVFVSSLLIAAYRYRAKQAVLSFSILWFFGLHLIESSYIPLELYFEHRNYMAMLGPFFALCWYLSHLYSHYSSNWKRFLLPAYSGILFAVSLLITSQLTNLWSNVITLHSHWAQMRPESPRAQLNFADYNIARDQISEAEPAISRALNAHPNEITVALFAWNFSCRYGYARPFEIEALLANPSLAYHRDDINYHLRQLLENIREDRCELPNYATLEALFARIAEFPMGNTIASTFNFNFAEFYAHYEQTEAAIGKLDLAFEHKPLVDYKIRQIFLASALRQPDRALEFVREAYEADDKRGMFRTSNRNRIQQLESILNLQL